MAHTVFDTESIESQLREEALEKQHQIVADEIGAILAEAKYIEENDFINQERQAGRKLTRESFESRVKKLNSHLIFKTRVLGTEAEMRLDGLSECQFLLVPNGSSVKTLVWLKGSQEAAIAAYTDLPVLNEFDIVLMKERIISRVTSRTGKDNMITDLPAYDINYTDQGPNIKFHGLNNLQQRVYEPNGRIVGWRSVLAMAIRLGALNLEATEREFDAANRASWSDKLGKQNLNVQI